MKCVHIIVSGRVQGVFFRDNTRRKARELVLSGYAKNLPDGKVEVVVEGDESKINELIEFIRKCPGNSQVTDIKIKHKELENFHDFDIIHQ